MYYQHLPHFGDCVGQEGSALFGCFLLTSYLGLFINFYFQTYKKSTPRKANGVANGAANGTANGVSNGHANGKAVYVCKFNTKPHLTLLLGIRRIDR
jgi:fatty acid elongase 3